MNVFLRKATASDALGVAALHAESWRANYRGEYRDDYLDGPVFDDRINVWTTRFEEVLPNMMVEVACNEDKIVGFCCVFGGESGEWGSLLDNLHVSPNLHSQGVGAKLMHNTFRWCHQHYPSHGLYLWVLDSNKRAQAFYSRQGAIDCGGEYSEPKGGGQILGRRYVWKSLPQVPE